MILGAHIGIGGGLPKAADMAHLVGCEALQIFTSNPQGWKFTVRSEEELANFKKKLAEYNIKYAVGHAIYLINIASPNPYIYNNSINSLISGLVLAEKAGLNGVVLHVGSHTGSGFDNGIKQIVNALDQALNVTEGKVPILLETDAGSGNRIGCKFSDIGLIIRKMESHPQHESLKVCLDTCHIFASGYDIRTAAGLEKTIAEFDKEIGLGKLSLIHLTCDALGIKEIHFCGITPDCSDKKVQKTSLGAEYNIKGTNFANILEDLQGLKKDGRMIIGLEISPGAKKLDEINFNPSTNVVLVVGNEVSGLSGEVIELCDFLVQIPMKGIKESLNVSVAFGIAAYSLINATDLQPKP